MWWLVLFLTSSSLGYSATAGHLSWVNEEQCLLGRSKASYSWSHPPICTRVAARKIPKYCVYTHSAYNNGNGISLIARPEVEDEILALLQHSDNLTERGRMHLASRSNLLPYEVREQPGRGRGVFARRTIQRGTVFLVGFPAVLIDQKLETELGQTLPDAERLRLYRAAYERLPARARALSLAASSGGDVYEDIVRTNGFGTEIGTARYSGVFPEISMLNHDCRPNAIVRFSRASLSIEAIAVRDVEEGEELSISYTPPDLPTSKRQALLEAHYFFRCNCQLCSAKPDIREESDARRERIVELRSFLQGTRHLQTANEAAMELLERVKEEGLDFKLKEYHNELAMTYYRLGDIESAISNAEEALRWAGALNGGQDDEFQRAIRGNLDTLRQIKRAKR